MEDFQLVLDYPALIGNSESLEKDIKRVIWGQQFTQCTERLIHSFNLGSSRIVFSHCCHKTKLKTRWIHFRSSYVIHFCLYRTNILETKLMLHIVVKNGGSGVTVPLFISYLYHCWQCALSKLLSISVPQFTHLQNEDDNDTYAIWLLWQWVHTCKHLEKGLIHIKWSLK